MSGLLKILIIMMFVITGCQHHPPGHKAPDKWPEKPKSQDTSCPDISGTYYEVGVDSYSNIPFSKENPRDSAEEVQKEKNYDLCTLKMLPNQSNYRISDMCSLNAILNKHFYRITINWQLRDKLWIFGIIVIID